MLWCSIVPVHCIMNRTGMCRFGVGNWIFLLATLHLFTYAQGGDDAPDEGVQFTTEPSDVVASAGERVQLACAATARGALRLAWRHSAHQPTRDHALSYQDKDRKQLSNGTLVIEQLTAALAGNYQCVATGDAGTVVSRVATVFLAELPKLLPGPRSVLGVVGGPILLPCPMEGPPRVALRVLTGAGPPDRRVYGAGKLHFAPPVLKLNVTWLKNGSPIPSEGARVAVTPSGALELDPARPHDAGSYRCRVAIAHHPLLYASGEETEVRVGAEAGGEYPPRFVATPLPAAVVEGASVTFDCAAVGNPKPEIVWLNNGVAIDLSDLDSRLYLVGSGSLRIQAARALDAGAYTCRAHSRLDSADHSAPLAVLTAPRVQLASKAVVAARGGDVTLRCSARGKPPPKVTWLKDGEPVTLNDHDIALVDGSSLRIAGLLGVDAGMWQCRAASVAGSHAAALRLSVSRRPEPASNTTINPKSFLNSLLPDTNLTNIHTSHIFNSLSNDEDTDSIDLGETSPAFTSHDTQYEDTYDSDYNQLDSNSSNENTPFHAAKELDLDELRGNATVVSAPRELRAVIVKHRFVTLAWEEPEVKLEEITGYAIVYRVKGSERQRVVVSRGAGKREANVPGLQPNTTYQFAALALAAHAASPPAQMIEVTTPEEELSFGAPTDVRVEAVGAHALRVSWAPPPTAPTAAAAPAAPDKYVVYYTEVETGREQIQWVDTDPSTPVISTTVGGLRAAAAYDVRVAAGGGAPSAPRRAATPALAPAAPPANVTATPNGATSIVVSWSAPPPRTHRGPLTGYKVRYRAAGGAAPRRAASLTTPADARRAELRGLDAHTTYQIRVCALNANGSGPFSEWVTAATQQEEADDTRVPPPPPPLTTRAGRDWVSVWWGEPRPGARGYSLGWGLGVPDERTRELPALARSHVITGLEPNAEYVISLRASNALGLGPAVYATVRTKPAAAEGDDDPEEEEEGGDEEGDEDEEDEAPPLLPPVGVKVIMLSGTTAVVYWTDPTLPKGQTATDGRRYVVRWAGGGRTRSFNASDLNCMLDDLRPATTYEFAVKLIKGGRESAWSMLVSNTTLEAPPGSAPRELRAAPPAPPAAPARAIDLSWAPPAKPNGVITGYVIAYSVRGTDQWTAVGVGGAGTRARLDRLRARTAYTVKVQARNARGLGPFCAPIQYTTPADTGEAGGGGGGLAAATSAWLWASAGGACAVLALAAALALSLCCRRQPASPPHDTSTYQKASASAPVPPDLWIHHDQMELKPLHSSHISGGSCEAREALASSTLTLRAAAEYEPARRPPHTLPPPRAHVAHAAAPAYVAMGGVGGGGSLSSVSNMGTLPSCRPLLPDQTPLLGGGLPLASPQSSLASLHPHHHHPPPPPCGAGGCARGAGCGAGDVYASAARERGHYVAYEPLAHYTHRDSLSSEGGMGGAGGMGGMGGAGGMGGMGGSLPRRGAPLHSFSDTSDHSTPSHSNRSMRESSPYKKSASPSPGPLPARLHLGGGSSSAAMSGASCEELEPLAHSRSSERLQQEVTTLEGLMKDLSAITQQQFHC